MPSLFDRLLSLLFPDRCCACAQLGALFCPTCCSALTPYPHGADRFPPSLSDVRIAFLFSGPLRKAVHQFKYRSVRRLAQPFGQLMAKHCVAERMSAEAILAVPLHPQRQRERGFNQSEELAREVGRQLGLPLLSGGLVRLKMTTQQARLSARERAENMRGAFAWRAAAPPRRIILIDDVLTTGATMGACALALREAGAEEIYGLALARSRPDQPSAGLALP